MTNFNQSEMKHSVKKRSDLIILLLLGVLVWTPLVGNAQEFSSFNIPKVTGTWVFQYGKATESPINSGNSFTRDISMNEILSNNYFELVPLKLQFGENHFPLLYLKTPMGEFRDSRYDWVEGEGLQLEIFRNKIEKNLRPDQIAELSREDLEEMAIYFNVQVRANTLSLQYRYMYRVAENEYVEGILTVYMQRSQEENK